jgi:hypothetical protein
MSIARRLRRRVIFVERMRVVKCQRLRIFMVSSHSRQTFFRNKRRHPRRPSSSAIKGAGVLILSGQRSSYLQICHSSGEAGRAGHLRHDDNLLDQGVHTPQFSPHQTSLQDSVYAAVPADHAAALAPHETSGFAGVDLVQSLSNPASIHAHGGLV